MDSSFISYGYQVCGRPHWAEPLSGPPPVRPASTSPLTPTFSADVICRSTEYDVHKPDLGEPFASLELFSAMNVLA